MPNRSTVHSRKQQRRFVELRYNMRRAVQKELLWLWRSIRGRLGRMKLQKEYTVYHGLWNDFQERLHTAMMELILIKGVEIIRAEIDQMATFGSVADFDYMSLVNLYSDSLAMQIVGISEKLQSFVSKRIGLWYKTPGETLQTLVNDLKGEFGLDRAELIAQTEITRLNSNMQSGLAGMLDIKEWWWETRRDQLVCTRRMVGPDGNIYHGCRGLHGKVFKMTDKMPPDASHPGCRCGPKLMRPERVQKVEIDSKSKTVAGALRVRAAQNMSKIQTRNERIITMARKHFTNAVTGRLVPLIDRGKISGDELAKIMTAFDGSEDPREGFNQFVAAIRPNVTVDDKELNRILLNVRNRYYQKLR